MPTYRIQPADGIPALNSGWDSPEWARADTVTLTHFRPEGSSHRPRTSARLLYNNDGLYGMFHVEDRYVVCRHTKYMDPVYTDSCVEFFVTPKPGMLLMFPSNTYHGTKVNTSNNDRYSIAGNYFLRGTIGTDYTSYLTFN